MYGLLAGVTRASLLELQVSKWVRGSYFLRQHSKDRDKKESSYYISLVMTLPTCWQQARAVFHTDIAEIV